MRMLVTGEMYEVMDSEVGSVGEKHIEYKADTPYWRSRLFVGGDVDKPKKFSHARVYNSRFFDDSGKWFDAAFKGVAFVPQTEHQGIAGPYSNGAHFDLEGDCWGVSLGEVTSRHPQGTPRYALRQRKRSHQEDSTAAVDIDGAAGSSKKRNAGRGDKHGRAMLRLESDVSLTNKENIELRSALRQAELKGRMDGEGLLQYQSEIAALKAELKVAKFKADVAAAAATPLQHPPAHSGDTQLTQPPAQPTPAGVPTVPGALSMAEVGMFVDMKLREAKAHIDQQRANDAAWFTALFQRSAPAAPAPAPAPAPAAALLPPALNFPPPPITLQHPAATSGALVAPSYFSRLTPPPSLYQPAPQWAGYPHQWM